MSIDRDRQFVVAPVLALALAGVAAAQDGAGTLPPDAGTVDLPPIPAQADDTERFQIELGVLWQDDQSMGGGGRYGYTRSTVQVDAKFPISDSWALSLGTTYDFASYSFDGGLFTADTWEDVSFLDVRPVLEFRPDANWTIFGGIVAQYAGEDGADFDDSLTIGGTIGVVHENVTDDLTLGIGLTVLDQIEDDARMIPVLIADWEIANGFHLSLAPGDRFGGATEASFIWEVDGGLTVQAGITLFDRRRFRLDDQGAVPDGVGQEEQDTLFFRAIWSPAANFDLTGYAGIALEPDVEIEQSNGDSINQTGVDESLVLGLRGTLRF